MAVLWFKPEAPPLLPREIKYCELCGLHFLRIIGRPILVMLDKDGKPERTKKGELRIFVEGVLNRLFCVPCRKILCDHYARKQEAEKQLAAIQESAAKSFKQEEKRFRARGGFHPEEGGRTRKAPSWVSLLYRAFQEQGPMTAAEIQQITGHSSPQAAAAMAVMQLGIVVVGFIPGNGSRPRCLYDLRPANYEAPKWGTKKDQQETLARLEQRRHATNRASAQEDGSPDSTGETSSEPDYGRLREQGHSGRVEDLSGDC